MILFERLPKELLIPERIFLPSKSQWLTSYSPKFEIMDNADDDNEFENEVGGVDDCQQPELMFNLEI